MSNAQFTVPHPLNEPVKMYAPGSAEKAELKAELKRQRTTPVEIPTVIGGRHLKGKDSEPVTSPHNHKLKLGSGHKVQRSEEHTSELQSH